jgi:hypothetical protein
MVGGDLFCPIGCPAFESFLSWFFFNGALVFMHLQNTSRAAVPARRGRHIRVFLSAQNLSGAPMTFSPLNNSTPRKSVVLVLPVSRMPLAHILTFRLVYTDPAVLSVKCDSRFERPAYQQSRLVFECLRTLARWPALA